jgi:hypothetical protein
MEEMSMESSKVETSFRKGKVYAFLDDLIDLCIKHNISVETSNINVLTGSQTEIKFYNWDSFTSLEVDPEGASLYWPRIQTDIVVRRKK